jgi:hypothetical protein
VCKVLSTSMRLVQSLVSFRVRRTVFNEQMKWIRRERCSSAGNRMSGRGRYNE